jgi:hypothetical protein
MYLPLSADVRLVKVGKNDEAIHGTHMGTDE